ncbi:hypothetical protein P3342_007521 [Pyrenophora teres f. teres]|nr:hypothetical protein P3342_007521 [Pyrenophora teres f. teres]
MNNPFLIQEGPTRRTPLFLIHDGGGTIFHYCLLQNLGRDVWGVYNPKFNNEEVWTGGLSEMAKVYVTMLKSVISCGNVIIGVPKDIRLNVQRCVDQAVYMLSRWRGPDWSRQEVGKGSADNLFSETTGPPPAILIRATEKLPTDWKRLDAEPEERLLRWDKYCDNFFKKVLDVPGHHFSMFERQNINKITDAIRDACELLEKLE